MLSKKEYNDIVNEVNKTPSTISNNTRKNFRKQIKEYEYAATYIPFEPLPHISFFINRTTTEQTLQQIIQAATTSKEFILDTESINVYKIGNQPALIQLLIILPNNYSLALIIEVSHLPSVNHIGFTLIKELLRISFSSDKTVYIWGSKTELIPFLSIGLFSREQINHMRSINLQNNFKRFWNEQHPHQSHTSSSTSHNCICEKCLGKKANELWSLQDAVAHELKTYLSKQLTMSDFNTGLDSNLYHMNQEEQNYRKQLSKYALDDCFSLHTIIINMKKKEFKFNFEFRKQIPYDLMESISSSDDDELMVSQRTPSNKQRSEHEREREQRYENEREREQRYEHEREHHYEREGQSRRGHKPEQQLSSEERKRIHNRRCTIKQRHRYYKNEIIIKHIDQRFTYREVKDILKQKNIPVSAVNTSRSSYTNERTLFIGVRDKTQLSLYEREIQHLFTISHYRQFQRMKQQIKHHYRNNQRHHHQ